ncbi:MAG: oligosaccharide flippase family protein [Ardenticatenaceae bacterium]|nr:oligosaccharide flippase family protein [Ardenticatenaceae bacterium]
MSLSLGFSKQLRSNALTKLASELIGRLASFVLVLGAARQLSEADFGRYNYGLALGFVLAQLADFGLQLLLAREVAASAQRAKPLVLTALRLKLLLSLPVIALLLVAAAVSPPPFRLSLLALGLAHLGQTFLEFAAYIFRGEQRLLVEAQLLGGARVATAVLSLTILTLKGTLTSLALTQSGSTLLMVGWAMWRLRRAGWLDNFHDLFQFQFATLKPSARFLLNQSLPLGISIFLSIAYTRSAIFLLQFRLGEVAVAHFSAAHRLVEPTQILPASLVAAAFPAFTTLLHQQPAQAKHLGLRVTLLLAFCGLAVSSLYWLTAPWLVPLLYGDQFGDSVPVLQWLGLSIIPAFINYSLTHYLIARGQQRVMGWLTAVMLLLHAGLSWLLIPHWGVIAPAFGIIAAETALLLGCLLTLTLLPIPSTQV